MKKSYSTRVFFILLSLGVQNADAGFTPKEFLKHIRPLATAAVLGCTGVGCTNGGGHRIKNYGPSPGTQVWINSIHYDPYYQNNVDLMGWGTVVASHRNYVTVRIYENEWQSRDIELPYSAIRSQPTPAMRDRVRNRQRYGM